MLSAPVVCYLLSAKCALGEAASGNGEREGEFRVVSSCRGSKPPAGEGIVCWDDWITWSFVALWRRIGCKDIFGFCWEVESDEKLLYV